MKHLKVHVLTDTDRIPRRHELQTEQAQPAHPQWMIKTNNEFVNRINTC